MMNFTGLTLEEAQRKYRLYSEAEEMILLAKEYEMDGRILKREDLEEVRKGMKYWEAKCNEIGYKSGDGIRVFRGIIKND